MSYISREKLVSEITKLYPGYDEAGERYLKRSQVLKVIQEQPSIEMQKCCATCLEWDKERNRDIRCFCRYIEAHTEAGFVCAYWEEDTNHGSRT